MVREEKEFIMRIVQFIIQRCSHKMEKLEKNDEHSKFLHEVILYLERLEKYVKNENQKQIEELESDRASEGGVSLPKQWQKCPLCNGDGIIATPILETVNSTHQVCSVCNGKKIILMG